MKYAALYDLESAVNAEGKRLSAQLQYGVEMSAAAGGRFDGELSDLIDFVHAEYLREGAVTKGLLDEAERRMAPLSQHAKQTEILCVSHAHIDMNWMWSYAETVSVTLATFRTALKLMDEYPEFTFSQSQASVYQIVETYDPAMLEEIRRRVHEGRWELSASTWVENDKNMPDGESQIRHVLYTKEYLSKLFGIDPDSLNLDFEPDTFGHCETLPEILASCGVRYYYHCRGNFAPAIYRWRAKSGKSLLVYREPTCYNWNLEPGDFRNVPAFCKTYGISKFLRVYGMGDHGGGATRREIERILDMRGWPLMPKFKFSTYREFYEYLSSCGADFEELKGEQNYVFPGCYTSQSRIKAANRRGERQFFETESLLAAAKIAGLANPAPDLLLPAWKIQLFNHFHDILPGSGTIETREFALGQAQRRDALLGVQKTKALEGIAAAVDTSRFGESEGSLQTAEAFERTGRAEGAGVGFSTGDLLFSANYGRGAKRVFLLCQFNNIEETSVVLLTLWDDPSSAEDFVMTDSRGRELNFEVLDPVPIHYWGHWYRRIQVEAPIPANGYSCVVLDSVRNRKRPAVFPPYFQRQEKPDDYMLENEFLRIRIHSDTGRIVSLFDKESDREMLGKEGACFRFVTENASKGMSSWMLGHKMKIRPIDENVRIIDSKCKLNGLEQSVCYETEFGTSKLRVRFSLAKRARFFMIDAECDFCEVGRPGESVPALEFRLPVRHAEKYLRQIPFGIDERGESDVDFASVGFAAARSEDRVLLVTSDGTYGFRCQDDSVTVNLIRGSTEPDPMPENGRHNFQLGIAVCRYEGENRLGEFAKRFAHPPISIPVTVHPGTLPFEKSFYRLDGSVCLSSVKLAEDGSGVVFRLFECEGKDQSFRLEFSETVGEALFCDGLERTLRICAPEQSGNELRGIVPANSVVTLKVRLQNPAIFEQKN